MDEMLRDLYGRYVKALDFYNSRLQDRWGPSVTILRVLPEEEFAGWWASTSLESELQQRWLERFDDPAAALARDQERITGELRRIPIQCRAA